MRNYAQHYAGMNKIYSEDEIQYVSEVDAMLISTHVLEALRQPKEEWTKIDKERVVRTAAIEDLRRARQSEAAEASRIFEGKAARLAAHKVWLSLGANFRNLIFENRLLRQEIVSYGAEAKRSSRK